MLVRRREYRDWRATALALIAVARLTPLPGRCPYSVTLEAVISRRRDLDGIAKSILDVLAEAKLTPDDRWCDRLELNRVGKPGGGAEPAVRVEFAPL